MYSDHPGFELLLLLVLPLVPLVPPVVEGLLGPEWVQMFAGDPRLYLPT
jgi:hypothetical protein